MSADIYDMEAASAMKGLGVSHLEVTVTAQRQQPNPPANLQHVFGQKALPPRKTSRLNELPTMLINQLVVLLEK